MVSPATLIEAVGQQRFSRASTPGRKRREDWRTGRPRCVLMANSFHRTFLAAPFRRRHAGTSDPYLLDGHLGSFSGVRVEKWETFFPEKVSLQSSDTSQAENLP